MSWLYSIVVAGLLFASESSQPVSHPQAAAQPMEVAAQIAGDETEKFEQNYPISRNGNVSVSNVNGSITVEAWDRDEVHLEAIKIADSKETLGDVELMITSTADSFSVEAEYKQWKWNEKQPGQKYRKLEVQFRLSVPRTAVLNQIETVNGSVTVSNFTNITKISAVNGNVNANNIRGMASLDTVNGEVIADFDRVDSGNKINLSTVNGKVRLTLPSDVSATIRAESLNGNIINDFGLPIKKGEYVGRTLYGRVGSGGSQVKLSSVNGDLTVSRKNDGRSPAPATNLLQNKKTDDDWGHDTSGMKSPHVTREVTRAIRESRKVAAESMKEASKSLEASGAIIEAIQRDEMKKLEKMKIEVDEHKINEGLAGGMRARRDAMRGLREAMWLEGLTTVEKKRGTIGVKGMPRVTIDAKGCSVTVRGWDKSETVEYVVTEVAERRGQPTVINESHDTSNVTLKVVNNSSLNPQFGFGTDPERVHIQVFVPRKANLKITTDGEIRLDGVSGDIQLKGDDESINVRDVDGNMSLIADEALVRVIGFKGDLNSQTACGDVFLEGEFKKLTAKATEGTVTLTLPNDANATFTSNTDVESEGVEVVRENERTWRLGKGGSKYNFDFTDGKLVVRGSSSVSAF
ncbi:MAG TPA: DUF4097 family beta strand repeat-containing protein [Pyrinomonadaceae bacterium]|nr:DUF4097 family beta strand repeat-containing protein [Pyrinomonadaceae bacterium]